MKKNLQKPSILLVKLDNVNDVIATSTSESDINPNPGGGLDAKERSSNPIWD